MNKNLPFTINTKMAGVIHLDYKLIPIIGRFGIEYGFGNKTVVEVCRDNDINDKALLSDREIGVLKLVARGYSNKEIAERLCISINTVITHRKNITEKLGIKTIAGLTVYAIMNNIINPDEVRR